MFPSDRTAQHLADPKNPWKRILVNATIKFWQAQEHLAPLVAQAKELTKNTKHDRKLFGAITELASKRSIDLPTGLMDVRIHDLRRTLGSYQAAAGANQYIIGKSLGHKSQTATAIYARLDLDPVRQSVQAASSAILNNGMVSSKKNLSKLDNEK